jgi:hypothetical protein
MRPRETGEALSKSGNSVSLKACVNENLDTFQYTTDRKANAHVIHMGFTFVVVVYRQSKALIERLIGGNDENL